MDMPVELNIDILYRAIEKGEKISLGKPKRIRTGPATGDLQPLNFVSRFLHHDIKKKQILIDVPTTSDEEEKDILVKNDKIRIFFVHRGFRFMIDSKITGQTTFQLASGKKIMALTIKEPEKLIDGERRNYFKVQTPPFKVKVMLIEREGEPIEESEGKIYDALMCTISGGGMAFREEKFPLPFEVKDIIRLDLYLDEITLKMEGEIKNMRTPESTDKCNYGVQFIKRSIDRLTMKKNVSHIMRYVVRRQRELIFNQ